MNLEARIRQLNAEWADAGDDVPDELKYIRLLTGRIDHAVRELLGQIDGGEELRGRDSEISAIIRILEGDA